MASTSRRAAAGASPDIEVLTVPDLDKLLAGEGQERPVEGEFTTADLVEQSGQGHATVGTKLRVAVGKGLVEYAGKRPRQGIDGIWRPAPHYRMVEK